MPRLRYSSVALYINPHSYTLVGRHLFTFSHMEHQLLVTDQRLNRVSLWRLSTLNSGITFCGL